MAIIKKRQVHEMPNEDLEKRLSELRLEFAKTKSQLVVGGAASNPARVGEIRRTIARILTELKKRGGSKTGRSM